MSDLTKADLRERLGNIDQIRDILFGPQVREFAGRIDQLERAFTALQQEMRNQSEEVKQVLRSEFQVEVDGLEKRLKEAIRKDEEEKFDIRQQIDSLSKRMASSAEELSQSLSDEIQDAVDGLEKKIKTITSKDEEEKFDIRQQIDSLSKRLSSNFDALDEAIDKQTTTLHDNLGSTRDKLQEDIDLLRTQVFEELERYFSQLTEVKLSRDDMAEMLFELGLRLKGTEFVPELREAAETPQDILQSLSPERSRARDSDKTEAITPDKIEPPEPASSRRRGRRSSKSSEE
jgi:uncharacterized phage infection (PIP) family protein YhgE